MLVTTNMPTTVSSNDSMTSVGTSKMLTSTLAASANDSSVTATNESVLYTSTLETPVCGVGQGNYL